MSAGWNNNFNAFRLVAASSVIVGHAYALELPHGALPEDPLLSTEVIGWIAVNTFFVMSGYLIMSALMRSPDVISFFRNRFLRIFPGLLICVLVSTAVLGLFFSDVSVRAYLSDSATWRYIAHNSTLIGIKYRLPGVFGENPYQGTVNGSLWTLPFEIVCYAAAGALAAFGVFVRRKTAVVVIAIAIAVFAGVALMQEQDLIRSYTLTGLGRLGFCFFIGMFYAQVQHRFPLRFWHVVLAGVVSAALLNTPLRLQAFSVALAVLVLWLAFLRNPLLRAMSALPDYSYGIYIYAFVIQQIVQFHFPAAPPLAKAALAFALVLPAASLSWHVIEKPALSLKKKRKIALGPSDGPAVAHASQARLG